MPLLKFQFSYILYIVTHRIHVEVHQIMAWYFMTHNIKLLLWSCVRIHNQLYCYCEGCVYINYGAEFVFVFIVVVVAVELCTHNLYYVIVVVFWSTEYTFLLLWIVCITKLWYCCCYCKVVGICNLLLLLLLQLRSCVNI